MLVSDIDLAEVVDSDAVRDGRDAVAVRLSVAVSESLFVFDGVPFEVDSDADSVAETVDVLDNERDAVVVFDTLPDPDSMDWLVDSVREALRECVLERDTL